MTALLVLLLALVEEVIACLGEALPDSVALLAGHAADLLPLGLQFDNLCCGLTDIVGSLQSLCLLAEGCLLLQIGA